MGNQKTLAAKALSNLNLYYLNYRNSKFAIRNYYTGTGTRYIGSYDRYLMIT